MSHPTHFAATLHARGRLPAVEVHGPICDRLLLPLASAASRASGWGRGEWSGHRKTSVGSALATIRDSLLAGWSTGVDGSVAEPLSEAEHAARFPDEPETPFRGGYPVAMFPDIQPATGA